MSLIKEAKERLFSFTAGTLATQRQFCVMWTLAVDSALGQNSAFSKRLHLPAFLDLSDPVPCLATCPLTLISHMDGVTAGDMTDGLRRQV